MDGLASRLMRGIVGATLVVALCGDDILHSISMGILSRSCRVIVTETGLLLAFL